MYLLYKLCFQKKNMAICFKFNKNSLKAFAQQKKTIIKTKRLPTEWVMIFTKDVTDKVLIYKIYKQLI